MKNWPKQTKPLGERIRINLTSKLLDVVQRHPNWSWKPLNQAREIVEFDLKIRQGDETAIPTGLEVEILAISYIDMYTVEEFSRLNHGLDRMFDRHGDAFSKRNREDVGDWFTQISQRFMAGAWRNLGFLGFDKKDSRDRIETAQYAHLSINHFIPSSIALCFTIKPSESFQKQFSGLISANALPLVEITHLGIRPTFLGHRTSPGTMRRSHEIECLFLSANKDVVQFLRKYLGVGMCMTGPLPSVEILTLNQSASIFPSELTPENREQEVLRRGFWRSLGLEIYDPERMYSGNYFKLYRSHRVDRASVIPNQALISTPDYDAQRKHRSDDNPKDEMLHTFLFFVEVLVPLIALRHLLETLQNEIARLRNRLSGTLGLQKRGRLGLQSLRNSIQGILIANGLHFQQLRVVSEFGDKRTRHFLTYELRGVKRKSTGDNDSGELVDDLIWQIERLDEVNQRQLGILKTSFSEFLGYKNLRFNYWVQVWLIFLTILILGLSVLQFLPEATRLDILNILLRRN